MLLDAKASLLIVGLAAHAACGAEPRTAAQSAHVDASAAAAAGARFEPRRSAAETLEEREGRPPAAGLPLVPGGRLLSKTSRQRSWVGARGDEDERVGGRRRLDSADEERRGPVVDHVARPDPILGKVFAATMVFEEGERRNEEWRRTVERREGDPSGFQMEIARRNSRRRFAVAERHNLRPHALREAAGRQTRRDSRWGK